MIRSEDGDSLPVLALPGIDAVLRQARQGGIEIFDSIRSEYVACSPEEWVRQHLVHFLVEFCAVPRGLIAIEKEFRFQEMSRRADIIVYKSTGDAWLLCECKAPHIQLGDAAFEQVARYNTVIQADVVLVSNGHDHYCYTISDGKPQFLESIPSFPGQVSRINNKTPDVNELQKELEVAVAAVRDAAILCQSVQSQISPAVLEKKDRSPVTVADFGSQAVVCRRLKEAFPADPVIAEEDADELRQDDNGDLRRRVVERVNDIFSADEETVLSFIDHGGASDYSERFWTLDPIDGTKGFLRGEQYAVALALIVDGEVVLAALACPNLRSEDGASSGVVYTAIKGQGAYARSLAAGDAAIIKPVTVSDLESSAGARFCESVESGHSSHSDSASVASLLGITADAVRLDSQAKYAVVARGEADVYMRLPTRPGYVEKIWDHAAGMLVITEAGGKVTDIFGKPLDFGRGKGLSENKGVIATNGRLHQDVIDALASAGVAVK